MNKETEQSLFHVRSSQAVISVGYKLYMAKFKTLFLRTWPFAIVYTIALALLMNQFLQHIPQLMSMQAQIQQGATPDVSSFQLITYLSSLVMVLTGILLCAPVFQALFEHQETGIINAPQKWYKVSAWPMTKRMLRLALWFFLLEFIFILAFVLIMVVGGVLSAASGIKPGSHMITVMVFTLLLLTIAMALCLPLLFTAYKYLLNPDSRFISVLKSTYRQGLRHWGCIFLVVLMVTIVTSVISSVVLMPYNILTAAITQSVLGAANGDPLGMPAYMSWMSFLMFCIAGFILAYIQLSAIFPFYYLYGSIEQQEKELKQIKSEVFKQS